MFGWKSLCDRKMVLLRLPIDPGLLGFKLRSALPPFFNMSSKKWT